jgi:hypothetical protein
MAKTSSPNDFLKAAFQDFVTEDLVSAPFTQIQNRALVSNSLKAVMGIDRIEANRIVPLPKEFGPNGEQVFELDSKDSRVRYYGNWKTTVNSNGTFIEPSNPWTSSSDAIEITFYGTGLNALSRAFGSGSIYSYVVDGGATQTKDHNGSSVIGGRSYNGNVCFNIVSGLSAGLHTVRLFGNGSNASGGLFHGFEILNERSNVLVNSGSAFDGGFKESLLTAATSNYNAGVTGTKGARVVKYIKNGQIGQVVQMVDASAAYLGSANHINEETVRKINFREFGANRGDDFSQDFTGAAKAFTLDDGTTTLVCSNYSTSNTAAGYRITPAGAGGFVTITFVGTGLDVIIYSNSGGAADTTISIDGSSVGTTFIPVPNNKPTQFKVASGLPYGTHTAKFLYNTAEGLGISDFVIYSPKKPTLPTGAVELCDYNVMADFVANTSTTQSTLSSGVLRKSCGREFVYVGAGWSVAGIQIYNSFYPQIENTGNGDYAEYTFFGTGVEFYLSNSTGPNVTTILNIDGSTNFAATNPSPSFGAGWSSVPTTSVNGPGTSFTASTGTVVQTTSASDQRVARISGLNLGIHKIRITHSGDTNRLVFAGLDIITPIHINNTKVGSLSMKDSRNTSALVIPPKSVDLSKAKAWLVYDQVNNKILNSFNISAVVSVSAGIFIVYWAKPFKNVNYTTFGMTNERSMRIENNSAKLTTSCKYETVNNADASTSDENNQIVCFGELENEENS